MNSGDCDLAIVGAGPAGMAAAIVARRHGLSVIVLDEQAGPGGQIYRSITRPADLAPHILGSDYGSGDALAKAFLASGATYLPQSSVWQADSEQLLYDGPGGSSGVRFKKLLLATGAIERAMPMRGWTLPGVMTAGAAQILLKSAATIADNAVFIGGGPLLYLAAAQYVRAGAPPALVLDTTPRRSYLHALSNLGSALRGASYILKGLRLLKELQSARIPFVRDVTHVELLGTDRLNGIAWRSGKTQGQIETEHAFLHQGVIPAINLSRATGCDHHWSGSQLSWRIATTSSGATSRANVFAAGDGAGIDGAIAARLKGELSALAICAELCAISSDARDRETNLLIRALAKETAVRPFLDRLYRPSIDFRAPTDDDILICRCEEVTSGALTAAIAVGARGPNQVKALTRCGMGPCQGRSCGTTITELAAKHLAVPPEETGYFTIRPPVKPVRLGRIADAAWPPNGE